MADLSCRRRVCFLIRSLESGGAERQLVTLASALQGTSWEPVVITFYARGALRSELISKRVRVIDLRKRGRWDVFGFAYRLVGSIWTLEPDVVHSYLTVANVVAVAVAPFLRGCSIVWGVRASEMDLRRFDWFARATSVMERMAASFPRMIVCNSIAGYSAMLSRGFPQRRMTVIPNGIDTDRFKRDLVSRVQLRGEWGVPDDCKLVAIVARLDPMKGHIVLLEAIAKVVSAGFRIRLACIGVGLPSEVPELVATADRLGLASHTLFMPSRPDPERVYSAIDLLVSASLSEGFSNSIAEAMSCEVPCVVTDVGDSASILGGCGTVVPAHDASAMAAAIISALRENAADGRTPGSIRGRDHIVSNFSVAALVARTVACLDAIANQRRPV